jgi:hypothetical protein
MNCAGIPTAITLFARERRQRDELTITRRSVPAIDLT